MIVIVVAVMMVMRLGRNRPVPVRPGRLRLGRTIHATAHACRLGMRVAVRVVVLMPMLVFMFMFMFEHRRQVGIEPGFLDQVPDLLLQQGQLGRVEHLDLVVLVHQLGQLRQRAVGVGGGHRRCQVVDDHRVRAALGLRAFARVVEDERVEQRQIAQQRIGEAGFRYADALARQPLQRAVLADVDDGVRPPFVAQPAVERVVVVRGRQVGGVVDRVRIHAVAARRLQRDEGVAVFHAREHELAVVHVGVARCVAPALPHLVLQRRGQVAEPRGVARGRHGGDGLGELIGAEVGLVVGAAVDQGVDQRVARLGQAVDAVALCLHGTQQGQQRSGRVQPDRVADLRSLAAGIGEEEGDALGRHRCAAQGHLPRHDAGHAPDPVGQRRIGGLVVFVLERHRHADDAAVELRQRHVHGRVERVEAALRRRPLGLRHAAGDGLDDRHVEPLERRHRPAGGGRPIGVDITHGERRGVDERVDAADPVIGEEAQGGRHAARVQRAQRGGVDRQGVELPLGQRIDQQVDEAGVAAQPVRAIEGDADGGPRRVADGGPVFQRGGRGQLRVVDAVFGQRHGRLVAEAGHQQPVGQAAQQLRQVAGAAGLQVSGRLLLQRWRHGRARSQFRIGLAGAADDDQRPALRAGIVQERIDAGNRLQPPQHAHDHDAGTGDRAGEQVRHARAGVDGLQVEAGHAREAVRQVRRRPLQRGEVGAGVGQQHDAALGQGAHGCGSGSTSPRPVRWKTLSSMGRPPARCSSTMRRTDAASRLRYQTPSG